MLKGLTSALTDAASSKTMTNTERQHANDVKDNIAFYEIMFGSIILKTDEDENKTPQFKKATLDPCFIQVLKANKNTKATRLMQAAIEAMAAEMNYRDNRFAATSNLRKKSVTNLSQLPFAQVAGSTTTQSCTRRTSTSILGSTISYQLVHGRQNVKANLRARSESSNKNKLKKQALAQQHR